MARADIVLSADVVAGASITLPSDAAPILSVPAAWAQYLQGIGGVMAVTVTKVDSTHVSLDKQAYIENILKLVYLATGELVRT